MTIASSVIPLPLTRPAHGYGDFAPPPWVADLFNLRHTTDETFLTDTLSTQSARAGDATLVTARIRDAISMDALTLQRAVYDAYTALRPLLRGHHAIRAWNYLPAITERMPDDGGRDRYMVFNAGRFEAFSDWYDGPGNFDRLVPTASGVGHPGADLVIHCLAAARPGTPVANPRQVQPFHYSQRFGPLPPCFARATLLPAPRPPFDVECSMFDVRCSPRSPAPPIPPSPHLPTSPSLLLVGGTASIRGEDSLHVLDFSGQLGETLANLAAMVHAAAGRPTPFRSNDLSPLRHYTDLRIYLPDANRAPLLSTMIPDLFPSLRHLEIIHADLCRPELLLEIEGLAELPC